MSSESQPENNSIATVKESVITPSINVSDFQKVSVIGNVIFAVAGLILGGYYFFKRLRVEENRDRKSRIREHARILLSYIDDYDKFVNSAVNAQTIKAMGKSRRDEINRIFQCIQHFLEANQSLFNFSEEEIQDIMQFHSVIDNSKLSRGKYSNGVSKTVRPEYKSALKRARTICWKKLF